MACLSNIGFDLIGPEVKDTIVNFIREQVGQTMLEREGKVDASLAFEIAFMKFFIALLAGTFAMAFLGGAFYTFVTAVGGLMLCVDTELKLLDKILNEQTTDEERKKYLQDIYSTNWYDIYNTYSTLKGTYQAHNKEELLLIRLKEIAEQNEKLYLEREKLLALQKEQIFVKELENNLYNLSETLDKLYQKFLNGELPGLNEKYSKDYLSDLQKMGISPYSIFEKEFRGTVDRYYEYARDMKEAVDEYAKALDTYAQELDFWREQRERWEQEKLQLFGTTEITLDELWEGKRLIDQGGWLLTEEQAKRLEEMMRNWEQELEAVQKLEEKLQQEELEQKQRELELTRTYIYNPSGFRKEPSDKKEMIPTIKNCDKRTYTDLKNLIKKRKKYKYDKEPWEKPLWNIMELNILYKELEKYKLKHA